MSDVKKNSGDMAYPKRFSRLQQGEGFREPAFVRVTRLEGLGIEKYWAH